MLNPTKNKVNYNENYQKAFKNIMNKTNIEIKQHLDDIIDSIYNGIMPNGNQVVLKNLPKKIKKIVKNNKPVLMSPREIRNAILSKNEAIYLKYPVGKNDSYHNLGKDGFYLILNNIKNPVMVIKENSNKIIVFTEQFDYKNKQVIVPIEINTISNYNEVRVSNINVIKSIHGRSSINNYIKNLLKKSSNIIYKDTKKIQRLIDGRKVQYPESIISVSTNNTTTNYQKSQ